MAKSQSTASPAAKLTRKAERLTRSFCRKSSEIILARSSALVGALEGVGYTCYDLQCAVTEAICQIEAPFFGPEDMCSCPWCVNVVVPSAGGSVWQGLIIGYDCELWSVEFTFNDGEVTLGEASPRKVEEKSGYAYVKDVMGDAMPEAARAAFTEAEPPPARKHDPLHRYAKATRSADGNFQVVVATEYPVRVRANQLHVDLGAAKKVGERMYEILSHAKGDANVDRLKNGAAFVDEHNSADHLGRFVAADVSDDRKTRGVITFDEVTELSRTRKKQMEDGSREYVSVRYDLTKFVGDEDMGDGTVGKRFAWEALNAASVDCPADPGARMNRSFFRSDGEAHCIHCGDGFDRSELNDTFECPDCIAEGRKSPAAMTRAKTPDSPLPENPAVTATPPIDSKQTQSRTATVTVMDTITADTVKTAESQARTKAFADVSTRNAKIAEAVKPWIDQHGMRKNGACSAALSEVAVRYCSAPMDDAVSADELLRKFGTDCMNTQIKYPAEEYRSQVELGKHWGKYSARNGIKSLVENKNECIKGCFEADIAQDMRKHAAANGGLPTDFSRGFTMPFDAPVPFSPNMRKSGNSVFDKMVRRMDEKMIRDMSASDFTQGGALIPTIMMLPYITLLRNRMCLEWAGQRMLYGMSGNIVWPRQISASMPSSISEVGALQESNPGFDQIRCSPHRVGNTVHWSLQLLEQSLPGLEAIIHEDSAKSLAIKLDYLGLNGTGANDQPLGIFNTPGINSYVLSGTPTLLQIIQTETLIRENNVYDPPVFLATSSSRGLLMASPAQLTGSTVVSGQTNALWVARGEDDEVVIGRPALDSQQVPVETLFTGVFEYCTQLLWGGVNIVYDQYTLAESGQLRLIYNCYIDELVQHAFAFTESTGMSQ